MHSFVFKRQHISANLLIALYKKKNHVAFEMLSADGAQLFVASKFCFEECIVTFFHVFHGIADWCLHYLLEPRKNRTSWCQSVSISVMMIYDTTTTVLHNCITRVSNTCGSIRFIHKRSAASQHHSVCLHYTLSDQIANRNQRARESYRWPRVCSHRCRRRRWLSICAVNVHQHCIVDSCGSIIDSGWLLLCDYYRRAKLIGTVLNLYFRAI